MSGAAHEPGWFASSAQPSPEGERPPASIRFLDQVRRWAPDRLGHLVRPSDTSELEHGGCVLLVDLPGFPDLEGPPVDNVLQVLWDGTELAGHWGDGNLWAGLDGRDAEALIIRGYPLTDDEAADGAVSWIAAQLARPVDLQLWTRGSEVVGRRWVLADTGRVLGRRGGVFARFGEPTEVLRLRPRPVEGTARHHADDGG